MEGEGGGGLLYWGCTPRARGKERGSSKNVFPISGFVLILKRIAKKREFPDRKTSTPSSQEEKRFLDNQI